MHKVKPLAIVLGGTNPHIPLIENLRGRGYHVILADYLEAPPAKRVADEHMRVSTLDMEGVLSLARARKASLVIAACVDRANVTAAFVAEQLGLPAAYNCATAERIANKLTMKECLAKLDVPSPGFQLLRNPAEAKRLSVEFPVVVKPIDCGGSKGVRKATDPQELWLAAQEAFKVTRAENILIEEFCEGDEVSADCFVQDGESHVLMLRKKHLQSSGFEAVLANYASVSPAEISPAARKQIHRATRKIVQGFGLRTTPLLIQFIVNGDDARVIEFAPRVGGGLNYRLVLLHAGVDLVDSTINAHLGRETMLCGSEPSGYISANHIYARAGRFGEVKNHDRLLQDGVIDEFYVHMARGAEIGPSFSCADRVASFIVRTETPEELMRKIRMAFERLVVLDPEGRSIIRRDIYLKTL
jgi:biotin carboxylase